MEEEQGREALTAPVTRTSRDATNIAGIGGRTVAGESPGCVQRCEDLEVVRGPSQRSLCSSLPPGSVSNPGLEINLPDEGSPRREVRLDNPDRPVLKLRRSDSHRHQIVRDLVDVR